MKVTDVGLDSLRYFLLLFLSLSSPRGGCYDLRGLHCFRPGPNSDMNCTWAYEGEHSEDPVLTLYYRSLKFHTDQLTPAIFSVPQGQSWVTIPRENMTSHDKCEVWVEGVGVGGRAASQHQKFDLQAVVVLSPPLLSVEEVPGPESENMLVNLELSSTGYHSGSLECVLQYREQGNHNWTKVISECDYPSHQEFLNLTPFTMYEVRARYIHSSGDIRRSDWSEPITFRSPESAPVGKVDAWRSLEDGELTVTWKALDPSAARSHSLSYILSYWERGQSRHIVRPVPCCNTTLPAGVVDNASIAASNSHGQTEPTDLYLEPAGLATTTQLWIQKTSGPALNISWIPNEKHQKKLQEYLLEWRLAVKGDTSKIQWRRFAASSGLRSVLLSDDSFQPEMPYKVSLYGLYLNGYGEPKSSICYIQEGVPSRGPPVTVHALSSSSALVTLGELPLPERRGIITHYSIIVIRLASGKVLQGINVSRAQNITISQLEPSTEYLLNVSASTSAGKSRNFIYPFVTSGASVETVYAAISVTVFLLAGCVLGIVFRARIRSAAHKILPKFCWQKIPDPVHSKMILMVATGKDKVEWLNFQSRSPDQHGGPEDPHIIEVEELPPEAEHAGEQNKGHLLGSSSNSPRQPDSMRTDAAGTAQVEWRPPIMSGYERHFMPTPEDLAQFT
ncbi:interleukin-27 receptor subunit alpha [Lissotriton helveticus]